MSTQNSKPLPLLANLEHNLNAIDIWMGLRSAEKNWNNETTDTEQRESILASTRMLAQSLKNLPASRWIMLNNGVGWTEIACTALSWCEGATITHVVEVYNKAGFIPKPDIGTDFPAKLLKPEILPENRLSVLIEAGERKVSAFALLIATRDETPAIDRDEVYVRQLTPDLQYMLALRGAFPMHLVSSKSGASASGNKTSEPFLLSEKTITERGWTKEKIDEALKTGTKCPVSGYNRGEAFRYVHPATGCSIVVDAASSTVIHVGRAEYSYRTGAEPSGKVEERSDHSKVLRPFDPPPEPETVYVKLRYEAVDVWRPVLARRMSKNVYCILPHLSTQKDESLEFDITHHAACEIQAFADKPHLTAIERANSTRWY